MIWLFAAVCILGPIWVLVSMIREGKRKTQDHTDGGL